MIRNSAISPDPSKDQHFLKDPAMIREIVRLSGAGRGDVILEVGAGIGTLTEHLIRTGAEIIAVEIDRRLGKALERLRARNLEVRYENVLDTIGKLDFNKVVSNTPYSICEPLMSRLSGKSFDLAVMSVPERFYLTISSRPGSEGYSLMSLRFQSFFSFGFRFRIPREAFDPVPATETVVILVKPLSKKFYSENPDCFILKEVFLQKRKLLKNSLMEAIINIERELKGRSMTKKTARGILGDIGLGESLLEKTAPEMKLEDFEVLRKKVQRFLI